MSGGFFINHPHRHHHPPLILISFSFLIASLQGFLRHHLSSLRCCHPCHRMLGYLPYERLGQSTTSRPFKAYEHSSMSLPPTPSLYNNTFPSSAALPPVYSTMEYRPPPPYDPSSDLIDISQPNPNRTVKVEDYYMPSPYDTSFGQTQASSKSSSTINMCGMAVTTTMGHPVPEGTKVLDISPTNMEQSTPAPTPVPATLSTPVPVPEPQDMVPPKKRPLAVPESMKDERYWDKRKKNNESAKRSREQRRMKEEQIAMRLVHLEQDNLQLRTEVSVQRAEIERLRAMLYNSWCGTKGTTLAKARLWNIKSLETSAQTFGSQSYWYISILKTVRGGMQSSRKSLHARWDFLLKVWQWTSACNQTSATCNRTWKHSLMMNDPQGNTSLTGLPTTHHLSAHKITVHIYEVLHGD